MKASLPDSARFRTKKTEGYPGTPRRVCFCHVYVVAEFSELICCEVGAEILDEINSDGYIKIMRIDALSRTGVATDHTHTERQVDSAKTWIDARRTTETKVGRIILA